MNDFSPSYSCYTPSGAFSLPGALVAALAAAVPLAFLYAFGIFHVPSVYLSLILTGLLGGAIGWVVSFGIRAFRIRNYAVGLSITFLAALAVYALHWPIYVAVLLAKENKTSLDFSFIFSLLWAFAESPEDFFEIVKSIYEVGVWSVGHSKNASTVKGLFLGAVWFLEFVAIILTSLVWVRDKIGQPYSERSDQWLEASRMPTPIAYIENPTEVQRAFAMNDFSALARPLSSVDEDTAMEKYAFLTVYPDLFTPFLSVTNVLTTGTGKKQKKKETVVFRYMAVTPSVLHNVTSALGGAKVG